MAYAKLRVSADGTGYYINDIGGDVTGSSAGNQFLLQCDQLSSQREFTKPNTQSGKGGQNTVVPYQFTRLHLTWTGHIDINSDSATMGGSNDSTILTILNGILVDPNLNIVVGLTSNPNPEEPNLNGGFRTGKLGDTSWPYKINPTTKEPVFTDAWLIKSTSITHGSNNTARLSVTLTATSGWEKLETLIDESGAGE